jgi:hypothetical protein
MIICLGSSSCFNKEERYRHIYIKNNSSKAIYYRLSFAFPDTTLKESDPNNYKINSGEQVSTSASSFIYNTTMQMFILDAAVVETVPWDSIVLHHQILTRYQFTEQFLESRNWTITYP